jgi:hypothetical protein
MENLIILNIYIFISILLLSLLILFASKKGYLGSKLKFYCISSSLGEDIILLIIISAPIIFILHFLLFSYSLFINNKTEFIFMVNNTNQGTNTLDPVRWWPSGTAQTWGILGTALGVYRLVPGSSRVKAIAALGSLGLSIPSTVYFHAVENPNGFNKLMFSWMKYKQTGNWPSIIPNKVQDDDLKDIIPNLISEGENKYGSINNTNTSNISPLPTAPTAGSVDNNSTTSFLPKDFNFNNLLDNFIPDNLLSFLLDFFRPIPVVGYLDDLIGQQLFIHLLLFIIVISLIILLTIYIFIQIMVNNKEFLLKKFNNKFILFFIKYQLFLAKISSFILPLLIMFGLIELMVGLYFILTHPIPYDKLDIDLHIFIK